MVKLSRAVLSILIFGLGMTLAARPARAGFLDLPPLLGITIDSSTLMPTPDPQWQIDFKASLSSGFTLTSGSYLRIQDIPMASGYTLVSSPYSSWAVTESAGSKAGTTTIQFTFIDLSGLGPSSITATTAPLPLGDFYVELTTPYFPGMIPASIVQLSQTDLRYQSSATNTATNQMVVGQGSTRPAIEGVPEPSSLLLLLAGLGSLYLVRRRPVAG